VRADELQAILTAMAGDRVAVVPAPSGFAAWFAGDDAAVLAQRARMRERSPELASQVSWIAVDRLPLPDQPARSDPPAIVDTVLERLVAVAWHEAVGVAPRSVDDDFFAAGGHSLLAADLAARLSDLLAIEVPLTMVLDRPTVSEQACWLATARAAGRPAPPRGPPVTLRVWAVREAPDALARGLAAMVARPGSAGELRAIDLSGHRGPARRDAWHRLVAELDRPFEDGAAWRAAHVELGTARALVVLAFDGRWFDPTSASLWVDDAIEACRAAAERREPVWPRRARIAGELEPVEPAAIGWRAVRIAPDRARALVEVGRRQAAGPLATLVAAVAVLVARRTGRSDVVLEVPASLRSGPEQRGALGPLGAAAAIAISFTGRPSFSAIVEQASHAICRGWAAAAGLVTAPADPAIADACVALDLPVRHPGGWREAARPGDGAIAPAFALRQAASGALVCKVGYDGVELTAGDAAAIADSFGELVGELVADPARALAGLPSEKLAIAAGEPAPQEPAGSVLTHAQDRLWFLESLSPGTTLNHLQRVLRLDGRLDRDAFARSLAALASRHDALRTVFRVVDGSPQQWVICELPLDHQVDALSPADDDTQARRIAELAAADYDRPFDFARGPLWRTRLCCVAPDDHRLILTIHHLIADALSLGVWHRELVEHYHAEVTGAPPRVGRIGASVAAVAAWERSPEGQRRIADDVAFWLRELAGARPLELPIDHGRPPSHGVGRHDVQELLSADRGALIRALGRRHGATRNVTLIAAAGAFVARHAQQDDVVCIVPAARRDEHGRRHVIGLLFNLLPLRLRLDGDPTFAEIVVRTQRALHTALAHSEAPFERIIAGLGLPRVPGRQPLFDVIINMVPGAERLWRGDLRVTVDAVRSSAQPCDLVIGASTKPGGALGLIMRCRDELFSAATAARMMARLRTLLLAAVAAPHTRLSELPVMPDDERTTVLQTWNRTTAALPEATVHGLVEARIRERPDAPAVIQGERALRYRELGDRADRLAARLRARVAAGAHVGVLIRPSPELAVAALGVLKAGAVYVPFDPAQPAARLAVLAREVELVVCEPDLADRVAIPQLALDGGAAIDPTAPDAVSPDAPAYLVFTSGSTGGPKGVATSHRALVNQIAWFARDLPWRPGEVACLRSSPAFVDSLWELFGPLVDGVPLVIATAAEMADPRLLAAAAAHHRVTRMIVVPSLLRTLLALGAGRHDFLPDLTLWLATSEELPPALVEAFFAARPGSRLVNLYGASETADQVAAHEVSPHDARAPRTPIGRPIANTQIYILDRAGRSLPIGVPGEICIAGAGLSERYLGDAPAEARARFTASRLAPGGRIYRSGDLGRWRHDGVLEFIGRFEQMLKIRGVRVDPGEVEGALLAHAGVTAAAVAAHPGFDGEDRLVGYVVARGAEPEPAELRRFLRARLPEPLVPTAFVMLDALPLGLTGKLDRAALPAPPPVPIASRPPHGAIEHAVALAWEQLLGRPVGADDDFFTAGGQSLLAAQLGARLTEHFGVELPLAMMFERPTVAAQAAWLEAAVVRSPYTAIAPVGDAAVPLSFAQERLWFAAQLAAQAPAPRLRLALRLDGALDPDRLEAAMAAIAARHPALRTVFTSDGPTVRQRVVARCPRDHQLEDLSGLSSDEQRAAVLGRIRRERDTPFALVTGPPWRTRLLRLADRTHVLIVAMHHYVTDGISMQLWLDELDRHYAALTAGRPPEVPELTIGPADVAVWQRRMADSGLWDASRAFWRRTLADAAPLDLPLIAPRTRWPTGRSGRVHARIDRPEVEALGELARHERTTVFGVLLAAAGVVLGRLADRRDVTIGTIAAGRDRPELRPLIGMFLNPLPLRLSLDGDPTTRALIATADRVLRAALAHSDVPFERIVADVNPERRPYRQPLFDVVINHHPPPPAPRIGDLRVSHVRDTGPPGAAPYELMIRTIERGHELTVLLDYKRERYPDDAAAGWLDRYVTAVRRIVADPDQPISALGEP
jgi:amino acid adenylation domain-containing protein